MSTQQRLWILCGGLASGKSTVRRLLAETGIDTIDADSIGHEVIAPGGAAFDEVAARWPSVVSDGAIDRGALAAIVFNDPGELRSLEAITHPHIFDTIRARAEQIDGPVVVEMPLLAHGLGDEWRRVVVDCRDDVRVERAVVRGMDRSDVLARLANQPQRREWLAHADLVIPNNGTIEELEMTLKALLQYLKS